MAMDELNNVDDALEEARDSINPLSLWDWEEYFSDAEEL